MMRFFGESVYQGIVAGTVFVRKRADREVKRGRAEDPEAQILRIDSAVRTAKEQLRTLFEKALAKAGEGGAVIFEAHRMMLEDREYLETIYNMIRTESVDAEYAVAAAGDRYAGMLAEMDDEYMKARATDAKDVSDRLIQCLQNREEINFDFAEASILVAEELTPSEVMQIDREKVLALVTVRGSVNSHASILARMMNIPMLVGVPMEPDKLRTGMYALVDTMSGEVVFEPDASVYQDAQRRMEEERKRQKLLWGLKGKENVTKSGRRIDVYANISGVEDLSRVLENDAGGIGLFRSEFLYLGRDSFPDEEEQLKAYGDVLRAMGDRKVVIRTLDIGADKQADYFNLEKEDNPALGCRAIRICLKRPNIFKTQLRALFRAGVYGNLSVMYPMITSVREMERIREIVEEVKDQLTREKTTFRLPEQGIMIETPAAVMIADKLAQTADFFSIGTNDLTQYALAIDRQNEKLGEFYDPHHEAILKMIQMTVDSAHKYGKRVGICGELGADLELTEELVHMGIDELSVSPSMVLPLRGRIREIS